MMKTRKRELVFAEEIGQGKTFLPDSWAVFSISKEEVQMRKNIDKPTT